MDSRFSLNAVICAPLLALALSAPMAVQAAGWSTPSQLAAVTLTNLPTNTASVAVGPSGESVAVWINEASYAVQFAVQSAAGVWSTAKTLYGASVNNGETTSSARVVIAPDGTATAIFASVLPGKLQYCVSGGRVVRCIGPSTSYAKTATLVPGAAAWTKPANLSSKAILVDSTQIGLDQNGNATALWTQIDAAGAPAAVQTSTRPAGGAWTAPQSLLGTANGVSYATLAVGAGGAAVAAWQEKVAGTTPAFAIHSRYSSGAGVWDAAQEVAALPAQTWTLRAAVDGIGQAALVWDNSYSVQWSRRTSRVSWSTPEILASAAGNQYGVAGPFAAYTPDVASDTAGNFVFAWLENDYATGIWTVQSRLMQKDGQVLSTATESDSLSNPHATIGADGSRGQVGWVNNMDGLAYSATVVPAAGWSAAQAIGPALWGTDVSLGSGSAGNASAVLVTTTPTRYRYKFTGSAYR